MPGFSNIYMNTEDKLFQYLDDYKDALLIMSQYPECLLAYKEFIRKKRTHTSESKIDND